MKISWFEILLIFAFRTSRQGSSRLRSIISVIDHPEGGYSTVVLHKNYVLGVLWSLNSIQTQYKRFWSILVDINIIFFSQNPDFGSQIRKLFPGPSLKIQYHSAALRWPQPRDRGVPTYEAKYIRWSCVGAWDVVVGVITSTESYNSPYTLLLS